MTHSAARQRTVRLRAERRVGFLSVVVCIGLSYHDAKIVKRFGFRLIIA